MTGDIPVVQPLPMCWKLLLLRLPGLRLLGRAVEMLEIICMKPFGMKVIGMAPLRMELAKLRTAAELLER